MSEESNVEVSKYKRFLSFVYDKFICCRGTFFVMDGNDGKLDEKTEFLGSVPKSGQRWIKYGKVPNGFRRSNYPKTKYTLGTFLYPGIGEEFRVVWGDGKGNNHIDESVRLLSMRDIQGKKIKLPSCLVNDPIICRS